MKFCPECGTKIEGMKYCPECGYKVELDSQIDSSSRTVSEEKTLLEFSTYMFGIEGKSKNVIGDINLSIPSVNYKLTTERLFITKQGVIGSKGEEIELYKIKDICIKQKLKDKMLGIGDIEIISADEKTPIITLQRIKDPINIKETIRKAVKDSKQNMNFDYHQSI